MKRPIWVIFFLLLTVPVVWKILAKIFRQTKYLVLTGHETFEKGEIIHAASAKQIDDSLVVPVRPDAAVPRQVQVNPQLADATEDESFQI